MKLFSWKTLFPLLILAVGAASFALLLATKPKALPIEPSEKAWLVTVEEVELQTLAPELVLYGRVESPRATVLAAALTADVMEVSVLEGMQVRQGRLLATLDERDSRLNLAQREADLAEMEAEIESEKHRYESDRNTLENEKMLLKLTQRAVQRMEQLKSTKVASESGLEEALQSMERQSIALKTRELAIRDHDARLARLMARRDRARTLRDLARLELERARIVAPFAGRIAKVHIAQGTRVRAGDPLIELYDTQALEVRAQIPGRYQDTVQRALAEGRSLLANAELNGGSARFRLDRFAGQISAGSGGTDALFRVMKGEHLLRLGSFVSLTLILSPEAGVIPVPYEAMYGTDRVYKLRDGRMRVVQVERIGEWSGADGGARALIRSPDLQPGDQLITTQLPNAIDGLRVQIPET